MRFTFVLYFTFALTLICALPTIYAQTDSLKATNYYQQAESFLLKNKVEKANKFFRKAAAANEKLTAAWRGLGITYELLDNYDSTVVQYQRVIDLNPNFSRVLYFELGRAFYRNGQYQRAAIAIII